MKMKLKWLKNVLRYYYNLNKFKLFTKINDLLDDIIPGLLNEIKPKDFNDKEKVIEMIMKKKQSINDYYKN